MHGSSGGGVTNTTTNTDKRALEREALRNVIQQWNANRLDLFELSEPNEDLEFHGVMRFYFQDSATGRAATKCIRVASDATAEDVVAILVEKFRPDMRMLTPAGSAVGQYALYEVHGQGGPGGGAARRLANDEKPLLVQLNWHIDDRDGRFLLRSIDDEHRAPSIGLSDSNSSFRRKLSKREKKQLKKQEKLARLKSEGDADDTQENKVAEKLYTELPETSFTRSISNPEAVMRRRRQQKLEKRLQQFRSKDGGPDTGGTLKIYGEALCPDVPYKTLLLSVRDCAARVVREMLNKYGLEGTEDPSHWCLVQTTQPPSGSGGEAQEYVLDDDECPLAILMNHPSTSGSIMFHVRRRPADGGAPRKRKKKPGGVGSGPGGQTANGSGMSGSSGLYHHRGSTSGPSDHHYHRSAELEQCPMLIELGADYTTENSRTVRITTDVMEVGSANGIALQLYGPHIQPRHCLIQYNADSGITTLTPLHVDAYTYVNGQRIHQTTVLQNGSIVKFGRVNSYRFFDPVQENRNRMYNNPSGHDNLSIYDRFARGQDPILPAVLEFPETQQEQVLARIITLLDPTQPAFKLAPAYTLYLCARYRASTHYRPELQPTERAHKLTLLLQHIATLIQNVIQERYNDSTSQAFWLANSSELLHFLKSDRHICAFSLSAQETLAESVQLAFSYLTGCTTTDLIPAINALLSDNNDLNSVNPIISNLSSTMSLLRHCRVNAALTIQLFSQLFHYISARSLNVILNTQSLCCKKWGIRLMNRLAHITRWAESQGLELAAECHLAKIQQCAHLLQAPKQTAEDIANLPSTCFKLNSVQLGALLGQYQCEEGEAPLSSAMVAQAVCVAQTLADELALADGREVRLLEQPTLPLALLLPEDGYSCDVVRGVPPGLADFLRQLQPPCRLASQPTSAGSWTVYMHQHSHPLRSPSAMSNRSGSQQQPEIQVIKLHKSTNGMGLSIVAAKGAGQERLGIYIKSVVPGGAADLDGRLQAGDQLLRVDGQSLIGITQERAAEYLVRTGPIVTLEVAKQGAIYHGLATLLQQPSPPMSRGPRRMSERDIPSRFTDNHSHGSGMIERSTIAASKSVPALHQVDGNDPPNVPQRISSNTLNSGPVHNLIKNHHDVFNPGYSRTSSSNSINTGNNTSTPNQSISTNSSMPPPKSKSVHNLVSPNVGQDQGFYQNLSVYRNKPPESLTLGDRASALRSSQTSLHSNNPLSPNNIMNNSQRPTSAYYSNSPLSNHLSPAARPNQLLLPSHHHQSIPNLKSSQSHSMLMNHQNNYGASHDLNHPHLKSSQSQSALLSNNYQSSPEKNEQFRQHSSMTALVRGQAKLAEMSEEVRRRQTRGMLSPQNDFRHNLSQIPTNSPLSSKASDYHHHHPQQQPSYPSSYVPPGSSSSNYSSQSQPLPHHQQQQQQQQHNNYYDHSIQHPSESSPGHYMNKTPGFLPVVPKPPGNQMTNSKQEYEDDPPPIPPTTTHPLYTASLMEPPKGAFYPTHTGPRESKGTPATNPWEREEREKEQEARREAARQWRDRQIAELSALPNRTPQQEEQLRALKLERDFQKRAEEAATTLDEDESTVSTSYSPQPVSSAMITSVTPVSVVSTRTQMNNPTCNSSADNSNESTNQQPTSILKTSSGPNSPSKRDNGGMNTSNTQQHTVNHLSSNLSALTVSSSDINAPPPPERGSSYLAMSLRTGASSNLSLKTESTTKRVSFNDNRSSHNATGSPISPQQNESVNSSTVENTTQLEVIREDPNQFITQAESMLASPTTPTDTLIAGATPGVIGAQEVYRDPRTRRLAEQQAKQASDRSCIPEKLSFKEKMKMFAMETGEQGTPKDRSKISRAQRDIDNIGTSSSSQGMVH